MGIYVYSKDGKVVNVTSNAGECDINAWYDFKERYDWKKFYGQDTEEDEAFIKFCEDLSFSNRFDGEFEIREWTV